jgi:mRNA-degrading endonuclease RelE of RelBE toxin-antitoxin system
VGREGVPSDRLPLPKSFVFDTILNQTSIADRTHFGETPLDFRIADTFTTSLARLTNDEQKLVKTTAFDLQLNPANPGTQFHKLDKAKDKNFWSARVGRDIRLILHKTPSRVLVQLDIAPYDRSLQILFFLIKWNYGKSPSALHAILRQIKLPEIPNGKVNKKNVDWSVYHQPEDVSRVSKQQNAKCEV